MSDLFHNRVTDAFILKVWAVMRATPHHHYQILTKRPERMGALVRSKIGEVLPNVWLGTSVENANVVGRIDYLRTAPAAIRFISFEPLIGPVGAVDLRDIHWAIVGGRAEDRPGRSVKNGSMKSSIGVQCTTPRSSLSSGDMGERQQAPFQKANGRVYRDQVWDEMPKASLAL